MQVSVDRTHPSGVNYELTQEEFDAGLTVALITGSIGGAIALADGTVYDVNPPHIAVRPEHLEELKTAIHKKHHAEGRYLNIPLAG